MSPNTAWTTIKAACPHSTCSHGSFRSRSQVDIDDAERGRTSLIRLSAYWFVLGSFVAALGCKGGGSGDAGGAAGTRGEAGDSGSAGDSGAAGVSGGSSGNAGTSAGMGGAAGGTSACDEIDADDDGFNSCDDCDDDNPTAHPDAPEVAEDGVDQNCNGTDRGGCSDAALGLKVLSFFASHGSCLDGSSNCSLAFGSAVSVTFPEDAQCDPGGAVIWNGSAKQPYFFTLTGEFSYDDDAECGYFSGTCRNDAGFSCEISGDLSIDGVNYCVAGPPQCGSGSSDCDPLTTCTPAMSGPICGDCPAGYAGNGADGCIPSLTSLAVSTGALDPGLNGTDTAYRLDVGNAVTSITLTPQVPAGAAVAVDGDAVSSGTDWQSGTLASGENVVSVVVSQDNRPDREYTLTIWRSFQEAYLKSATTESLSSSFGTSVAIAGDTAVVTSPYYGAHVFVRDGSGWMEQTQLTPSSTEANAIFGTSVAIAGDTVVVGAPPREHPSIWENGAAYVFVRSGTTWTEQAILAASNAEEHDLFGASVAIDGDTIVVGAPGEDSAAVGVGGDESNNTAMESGAAYVFVRSGSVWTQQAYVKASNTGAYDHFGTSAAISSDTIVVGAPDEDALVGAAYAFVRSGSSWAQQGYLKGDPVGNQPRFGSSVSVSDDRIAVGAPEVSGVAFVFARFGTSWTQDAVITPSMFDSADFGRAVTLVNDTLVVGSPLSLVGAPDAYRSSGSAYVFVRDNVMWNERARLYASNRSSYDYFGSSVALDGGTLIVGAPGEDSAAVGVNGNENDDSAEDTGAAYVMRL